METRVIQIGRSLGLRLPIEVWKSLGVTIDSTVRIELQSGTIVLHPVRAPRAGWAEAFQADPALHAPSAKP